MDIRSSGASVGDCFDLWYLERPMTLNPLVLEQLRDCCFSIEMRGSGGGAGSCALYLVVAGEGELRLGNRRERIAEGSFFLAFSHENWVLRNVGKEPVRFIALHIGFSEKTGRLFRALATIPETGERIGRDDGALKQLAFELMDEVASGDEYACMMAESCLNRIAVKLIRDMAGKRGMVSEHSQGAKRKDLAYETIRYIDRNLTNIRELGEIADALGYSYSRLSHVFRTEIGVSLQSYWNRRRIMYAMRLLQMGETSTRIAEMLHYQSVHSFSKAFKKIAGLSPSEYRQLYGRHTA